MNQPEDSAAVTLTISLYNRPDFRVTVSRTGAASNHEIKILHMDGHEVTADNPARTSEGLEVYITGYTKGERDSFTDKYTKKSGDALPYFFTYTDMQSGSADGTQAEAQGKCCFAYRGESARETKMEIAVTNGKTGKNLVTYVPATEVTMRTVTQRRRLCRDHQAQGRL